MKLTLVATAMLSMLALSACEKKETTIIPPTTTAPAPSQMSPGTTPSAMDSGAKPDAAPMPPAMTPPPDEKK